MLMKSTTYNDRLSKNWKWCQDYFERKKKQFHLNGWHLSMDKAKTRLGRCDEGKKVISVSYHFLRGPTCDEKAMRNTILHEIAHAIAGCHNNHNKVWKTVALNIGCDGSLCGKMDLPEAKYTLECPDKCVTNCYYRKPRPPKNGYYICPKCSKRLILKLLK